MANDTSKLTINNETYDIKDANARCSKYQYTLNKNNWSDNTYALSVGASNIDCKCYNTIELSNYYDINQWKTYGISIESTEKNYDGTTDTTTLATIYFKCETVPGSNLNFTIASFPSKTSINGDLVNPYNGNNYTNADKALVQDSPITPTATGSDLTLSTSSGNVNALTIYGKSEVVDSAIKSAGEGWNTVDLGTLTWGYDSSHQTPIFSTLLDTIGGVSESIDFVCHKYKPKAAFWWGANNDMCIGSGGSNLNISNFQYTNATDFKTAMSGVFLCYKLADPTQGNTIAVKTDNGSGIDGTMATFTTGTPLRGIPDTTVRDIMTWDGSSGAVTKNCGEVDLGTATYTYDNNNKWFYTTSFASTIKPTSDIQQANILSSIYTPNTVAQMLEDQTINMACATNRFSTLFIRNTDYTDPADFKTAMTGVKLVYELAIPTTEQLTTAENDSIAGLETYSPQTHAQNNAQTDMTVEAYAGTANGKAVNAIDINKETKSVTLSYADYVALPTKDPETSYYVPDAPDTWIFGYDLDKDDENPFTRVSYPADVDNTVYTPAFMDFTNDVFNYGSWNFKPGEKFMPNPCMLLYNGTVGYYLKPNDNTKKSDGTASDVADTSYGGNAMMEWGLLYTKRWEENGVYKFRVSNVRIDADWECWCNYDINNNVIPHFYTPIYFGSYDGTRMRSLSGQSNMVSTTAQQEIDRAKTNGSDIWYTEVTSDQKLIEDLAVLMCKSTAIQEKYGTGRISASSAIAPGTMNTKGMFWGDNGGTNGVKIFGMENPYGNIWRRKAGYTYNVGVQNIKLTRGTHDGSTATDYNITGDGYISISNSIITGSSGGYITEMITTPFGRFSKALGGSQTTFEADVCWHNDTYNGCYALVGGNWNNGRPCGLFCVDLANAPSNAASNIGASLSCKPLAV